MASRDLKVTLIGEDKTGRAFDSAGSGASKMVKVLGAAGIAAGAAVGAFVIKGVNDAMKLETSLREVNSLFGLSGKEGAASFKELQSGVAGVSKEVGIAQDTLTKGLYTAISAGVPRENAFTFLQDAAKLGIAGVADTETAVNALTGVMNAFQADNLTSAQAADLLFTTVRQGKTTLAELAPAIGTVGPAAAAAGVSFEQTAAALATVTKIIPNTSTAAAALRQVFGEADKTGTKFNKSLKSLGAETMAQAIEKFGSFQGVLQAVYEQTGSSDVAFKNLFGSTEAAGAALTMVGTNAAVAAADLAAMKNSTGNADLAFEEMNKSVARNIEQLKVTIQKFGITVGNKILPLINAALDKFSAWWASEGPGISARVQALGVVLSGVFTSVIPAVQNFASTMQPIVADLAARALPVFASIAAGVRGQLIPAIQAILPVVTPIAAFFLQVIGGAVIGAVKGLVTAVSGALNIISGVVKTFTAVLRGDWTAAWEGVKQIVRGAFDFIKGAVQVLLNVSILRAFSLGFAALRGLFTAGIAAVKGIFSGGLNAMQATSTAVLRSIGNIFTSAWAAIRSTVSTALTALRSSVDNAMIAAKTQIGAVLAGIKTVFTTMFNAYVGIVKSTLSTLIGAVKSALSGLGGIFSAAFNAAKAAVTAGVNAVIAVIRGLGGQIAGATSNFGTLLKQAGADLLRGLANGITGAIGGVINAAKDAARAAVSAVKSSLGIASPSRVAIAIGENFGGSFARGIRARQAEVKAAMESLAVVPKALHTMPDKLGRKPGHADYGADAPIFDKSGRLKGDRNFGADSPWSVAAAKDRALNAEILRITGGTGDSAQTRAERRARMQAPTTLRSPIDRLPELVALMHQQVRLTERLPRAVQAIDRQGTTGVRVG